MLDLYLIRHAESELNKHSDIIGGRSNDSPLSENGVKQAESLGNRLKDFGIMFDEVYSSTAVRAFETARIACTHIGYLEANITKLPDLLELDQGDWEGKPRVEVYTPEVLEKITADNWNFAPPNGESQRAVEERMLNWVNETLVSRYQDSLAVGVFSHGLAIKCLLRGIMDFSSKITYKVVMDNTSITRLNYSEKGWHILCLNDAAHLHGLDKIGDAYLPQQKS